MPTGPLGWVACIIEDIMVFIIHVRIFYLLSVKMYSYQTQSCILQQVIEKRGNNLQANVVNM